MQIQKLLASDAPVDAHFGIAVAIGAQALVVGASSDDDMGSFSGSVYVLEPHPVTGVWVEAAKLLAPDGASSDFFGEPVAVDGATLVAGASADDDLGDGSGSAYVFERQATTGGWLPVAKLLAPDGAALDAFGESVAIGGETVVVGAPLHRDELGNQAGAAYVFERDAGTGRWLATARLVASAEGARLLGRGVAIDGETAVAGAPGFDSRSDVGAAYVFERDAVTGDWVEAAMLLASDGAEDDDFGGSVALGGDTVVVGAAGDDDVGDDSGSAYVFERDPSSGEWIEVAKLLASDGGRLHAFGSSVAIGGELVAIGTSRSPLTFDSSTAYVFERDAATGEWSEAAVLRASDESSASARFGRAVAVHAGRVAVGDFEGEGVVEAVGSTYVFGTGVAVGGSVTGMRPAMARCIDGETGQTVVIDLRDGPHTYWDCLDAGLVVEPGDEVLLAAAGMALGTPLSGAVGGLLPFEVTCTNRDTGQVVVRQPDPLTTWDCLGLETTVGDLLTVELRTRAE